MKIYCMSDIHGCLREFEKALALFLNQLIEKDTMLILLGDYIHGGPNSIGVLDKIMELQEEYGKDKVIALRGNHEEFVLDGDSSIEEMNILYPKDSDIHEAADNYRDWMKELPYYYTLGKTIFVHAGIEEDAGEFWEWSTGEEIYTQKFPAQTGQIENLDKKIVAGHISTASISGDSTFHDIYYDGSSHYYIDGSVTESGRIPVLMVDTKTDKYYKVTKSGNWIILPYNEENRW